MKGINSEGGEVEVIVEHGPGILCTPCSITSQLSYPTGSYLARIYHPVERPHGTV